jgi:Holliday junction DNA helicase RuvA
MIVRITGRLAAVSDENVVVDRDGLAYEILIPAFAKDVLAARVGQTITMHTLEYYEGSAMGGNLFPRLVGFLEMDDRDFFLEFIKVKGVGYRKALRACAQPVRQIASAIERGDTRVLSTLPEIGKRTAEQMIVSLRGKLSRFSWGGGEEVEVIDRPEDLNQVQREALEILIQLGERRNEAVELIEKTCAANKDITDPGKIVEAVYKRKAGTR